MRSTDPLDQAEDGDRNEADVADHEEPDVAHGRH